MNFVNPLTHTIHTTSEGVGFIKPATNTQKIERFTRRLLTDQMKIKQILKDTTEELINRARWHTSEQSLPQEIACLKETARAGAYTQLPDTLSRHPVFSRFNDHQKTIAIRTIRTEIDTILEDLIPTPTNS